MRDALRRDLERGAGDAAGAAFEELPYGALVHIHARHVPRFIAEDCLCYDSPIVLHSGF